MPTEPPSTRYVIAADAGGTYTRVACFGLDGAVLASAVGDGGSPFHNAHAAQNVATTTIRAVRDGGLDPANAVALVAGLASISRSGSNQGSGDNSWADDFFAIDCLRCERTIVNDAVVAHRGALLSEPGVIAVGGTGSMILAIDAQGHETESGQLQHYGGAARHLVHEVVQLILIGAAEPEDSALVAAVLDHWQARDVSELRHALLQPSDPMELRHSFGRLAPVVTAAAHSSPLANRALDYIVGRTALGIRLLAPLVNAAAVRAATTGGMASDPAFTARLAAKLKAGSDPAIELVPARLDALRGAALMAYQRVGIDLDEHLIGRLEASQRV